MNSKYEAVIGLEVHAQLSTESKAFCSCSTKFGVGSNINVCPVCLGHPGVLPVLNKKVVEYTVRMGIATNCKINEQSIFARKNYFYPDLPKGYQISQYEEPICDNGFIEVKTIGGNKKNIGITRIHMEEDAGKSIHAQGGFSLVDVNRCGVPLIEIVSEPEISNPNEAYQYLSKIKQIVQYLEICDGNMEEGSLRCDANVSVRLKGEKKLGVKTEIKNMNSFRNVEKAIEYEIDRQIDLLEDGDKVIQQTLLWDTELNEAYPMRSKEEAHDYRYFPDPDLLPVVVDNDWKTQIEKSLPELPDVKLNRFTTDYLLPVYDSQILTQTRNLADYFEDSVSVCNDYKSVSNWITGEVLAFINDKKIEISEFQISSNKLGKLVKLISNGTISGKIAKEVFSLMLTENKDPEIIVQEKNLIQISDTGEIQKIIDKIINDNPEQVMEFQSGKEKVFGFFVGQVMKASKGKANPKLVNEILRKKLLEN